MKRATIWLAGPLLLMASGCGDSQKVQKLEARVVDAQAAAADAREKGAEIRERVEDLETQVDDLQSRVEDLEDDPGDNGPQPTRGANARLSGRPGARDAASRPPRFHNHVPTRSL